MGAVQPPETPRSPFGITYRNARFRTGHDIAHRDAGWVLLVALTYWTTTRTSGPTTLAHSLIPIAVGDLIANSFSLQSIHRRGHCDSRGICGYSL
jgi:hypothetical protein